MRSEFHLPMPPSVNGLFANNRRTGGRFKTKKYKAWITEAGWMLQSQAHRHHRHTGKVISTLLVRRPDNRRRDIGNLEKAAADLLVRHGIILDDSQIERSSVQWTTEPGFAAKVIIEDVTTEGEKQ